MIMLESLQCFCILSPLVVIIVLKYPQLELAIRCIKLWMQRRDREGQGEDYLGCRFEDGIILFSFYKMQFFFLNFVSKPIASSCNWQKKSLKKCIELRSDDFHKAKNWKSTKYKIYKDVFSLLLPLLVFFILFNMQISVNLQGW